MSDDDPMQATIEQLPEGVPEKFLQSGDDADNSVLAVMTRVGQAYTNAERHIGERDGDTLERLTQEAKEATLKAVGDPESDLGKTIRGKLLEGRPEKPDDYEVKLPEIEGQPIELADDDPLVGFWRGVAHEHGLDQDQFNAGIEQYVRAEMAQLPDKGKELEKLGERGQERVDAVEARLRKALPEDQFAAIQSQLSHSATLVMALETLTSGKTGPSARHMTTSVDGARVSEIQAEIAKLKESDAYWRGDPAVNERVQALHRQLAGDKQVVLSGN